MSQAHPYYPTTLTFPHYAPPAYSLSTLLTIVSVASGGVLFLAWCFMTRVNPTLTTRSKAAATWFLFCGLLHIHFEGYFIKYRRTLAGRSDIVAELWKEYAQSDSRYLTQDSFVVGIEVLTVVCLLGPEGRLGLVANESSYSSARYASSPSSLSSATVPRDTRCACWRAVAISTAWRCTL